MSQSMRLGPRTQPVSSGPTPARARAATWRQALPGSLPSRPPAMAGPAVASAGAGTASRASSSKPSGLLRSEGRSCQAAHRPTPVCSRAERDDERAAPEPLPQRQGRDVVRAVERQGQDGVQVDEGAHAQQQQRHGPAAGDDGQQRQERHGREDVALVDARGQDEEGDGQEGQGHEERPAVVAHGAAHSAPQEAGHQQHRPDGDTGQRARAAAPCRPTSTASLASGARAAGPRRAPRR